MSHYREPGKHIFVIDDDPAILQLFSDLLTDAGYQVSLDRFVRPLTDLLDVLGTMRPDLVIMDCVFNGEPRGWQLLQAARKNPGTRDIPFTICTAGITEAGDMDAVLGNGTVPVVIKPFDIDKLFGVIDSVWAAKHSETDATRPPAMRATGR